MVIKSEFIRRHESLRLIKSKPKPSNYEQLGDRGRSFGLRKATTLRPTDHGESGGTSLKNITVDSIF